ncbi:MAG: hypothetical protein K6A40_04905 [Solobacterium sp.]|nr:hypothetical protein [Solobacterium sp.]
MELNLKYEKNELFDPHVLTPHSELNAGIYQEVDALLGRSDNTVFTLCIYSEPLSDILKEKIREVYREHYSDELKALRRDMIRVYVRAAMLLTLSLTLLFISISLTKQNDKGIVLLVVTNFGAYFLWEVGNTWFRWVDLQRTRSRLLTAKKATVTFAEYRKKKTV